MGIYNKELRKLVGKIPLLGVGAGVLILDDKRRVLLQHRNDCDAWSICGGGVELGETVEDAARREVLEETNLEIGEMQLFNVFSGKEQYWIYPDGNEYYIISIVFVSKDYKGVMKADQTECRELKFFDINELPELISTNIPILRDLMKRINSFY